MMHRRTLTDSQTLRLSDSQTLRLSDSQTLEFSLAFLHQTVFVGVSLVCSRSRSETDSDSFRVSMTIAFEPQIVLVT